MVKKLQELHARSARLVISVVLCLAFLSGCLENGRVSFSEDGKQLAVCAADGLRLGDARGTLGPPVMKRPRFIDWVPNSNRLLVVTADDGISWSEMQTTLSSAEKEQITRDAEILKSELVQAGGDFEKCLKNLRARNFNGDYAREAIFALEATRDAEMAASLGRQWTSLEKAVGRVFSIHLLTVDNGRLGKDEVLYRTCKDIESVRCDSSGKLLAVVDQASTRRLVIPAKDGFTVIARHVSESPDWSPDGTALWYVRSSADRENRGWLTRARIKDGSLSEVKDMAEVTFEERQRVRCLANGDVLFSDAENIEDKKRRAELLMVLKSGAAAPKLLARRKHGDASAMCVFELSPDKSKVTVPGPAGALDIMQIATGKIVTVTRGDRSGYSSFAPCWQGNDRVCFTLSHGENGGNVERRIVVFSECDGKTRTISDAWPEPAIAGLLTRKDRTAVSDLKTLVSELYKMTPQTDER